MLPAAILEHLSPADAARALAAAEDPRARSGREIAEVLRAGAARGASAEQMALAVGVVLALAEGAAEPDAGR